MVVMVRGGDGGCRSTGSDDGRGGGLMLMILVHIFRVFVGVCFLAINIR